MLAYRTPSEPFLQDDQMVWQYHDRLYVAPEADSRIIRLESSDESMFDDQAFGSLYGAAAQHEKGFGGAFGHDSFAGFAGMGGYMSRESRDFGYPGSTDDVGRARSEATPSNQSWTLGAIKEIRFEYEFLGQSPPDALGSEPLIRDQAPAPELSNVFRISATIVTRDGGAVKNMYFTGPPETRYDEPAPSLLDWAMETPEQAKRFRLTLVGLDAQRQIVEVPMIYGLVELPTLDELPRNLRMLDWSRLSERNKRTVWEQWGDLVMKRHAKQWISRIELRP